MDQLQILHHDFGCRIHGFVLMSNHYHLLIETPRGNIGESMKYFQREVARSGNKSAQRINHFFGGRYKWSLIHNETYYWNAVKYVYRNPVTAGICDSVVQYPYSSLSTFPTKLVEQLPEFLKTENLPLDWIEKGFSKEHQEAIKKALRRHEFELPNSSTSGKIIQLDIPHYKKETVT